jgi:hypothetical protein
VSNVITSTIGQEKFEKQTFPEGCKTKSGMFFCIVKQIFYSCYSKIFLMLLSSLYCYYHLFVITIIIRWCYYHRSFALLSSSLFFQRRFSVHKSSMQDKITHDCICFSLCHLGMVVTIVTIISLIPVIMSNYLTTVIFFF